MKVLFAFIVFLAINAGNGEKMTEVLLRAQAELSLSHEFTESQFIRHRFRISSILETLTKFSIDKYMDSIDTIKLVAAETREQMRQFETSECLENALNRFELQVISHVNRLNFCTSEARRILNGEYYDLNYFDKDGARVSNHVQNQSFNIMSQNNPIDPSNDLYRLINNRLRNLLFRASPWVANMQELEDLMDHHIEQAQTGITMCTRMLTAQFNGIASDALDNVSRC